MIRYSIKQYTFNVNTCKEQRSRHFRPRRTVLQEVNIFEGFFKKDATCIPAGHQGVYIDGWEMMEAHQ